MPTKSPRFQRRHMVPLADAIKTAQLFSMTRLPLSEQVVADAAIELVVEHIALMLKIDNPAFDAERFKQASLFTGVDPCTSTGGRKTAKTKPPSAQPMSDLFTTGVQP